MKVLILSCCIVLVNLLASECLTLKEEYEVAKVNYESVLSQENNTTELYETINKKIDAEVIYLSYCEAEIGLSQGYQYMQEIRRDGKKRDSYGVMLLKEYRQRLGIKPKIHTVYQNSGYSQHRSGPRNMPPVSSQPLPPIAR